MNSEWVDIKEWEWKLNDPIDVRIRLSDGSELNAWQQLDGDFWNELLQKFIDPKDVTHVKTAI
jgi:hypothetical protein